MIIGIVGLGRMGAIYAERLLANGERVHVWNRSEAATKAAVDNGAIACASPRGLASGVDVLFVSLSSEAALDEIYFGENGILSASLERLTIVETSTVGAAYMENLGRQVEERGGRFLDAPVLGTLGPARQGQLVFTIGGDPAVIARVKPVLMKLGRKIAEMGPIGSGTAMKLMVNQSLCLLFASLGEALAMGKARGINPAEAMDVILDSAFASPALAGKLKVILGETDDVAFDLAGARKDLAAALAATSFTGPIGLAALSRFDAALAEGWGDRDVAAIAVPFGDKQ